MEKFGKTWTFRFDIVRVAPDFSRRHFPARVDLLFTISHIATKQISIAFNGFDSPALWH